MVPRFIRHAALAEALLSWSEGRGPLMVCIDGAGASGKSTLARGLGAVCSAIQIIHLDDFYRPSHERHAGPASTRPIAADFDLERLRREVLEPLRARRPAAYRRYDWTLDTVADDWTHVAAGTPTGAPIVLIEGVYSASAALAPFFDLSLWVECARDVRLSRGLARDGEAARARWELDWMPGEDRYIESERPEQTADLVCDGSRSDLDEGLFVVAMPGERAKHILPGER